MYLETKTVSDCHNITVGCSKNCISVSINYNLAKTERCEPSCSCEGPKELATILQEELGNTSMIE